MAFWKIVAQTVLGYLASAWLRRKRRRNTYRNAVITPKSSIDSGTQGEDGTRRY